MKACEKALLKALVLCSATSLGTLTPPLKAEAEAAKREKAKARAVAVRVPAAGLPALLQATQSRSYAFTLLKAVADIPLEKNVSSHIATRC